MSTAAYTPARDQVVIENFGTKDGYKVLRCKSTMLVGANQFSISVKGLPSTGYIYRVYVIYKSDNSLKTVYTDAM